eukprot:2635728-Heterocapsa_arctica.AAC.1
MPVRPRTQVPDLPFDRTQVGGVPIGAGLGHAPTAAARPEGAHMECGQKALPQEPWADTDTSREV